MSNKMYFITGGARSGKSAFAETLAQHISGRRAYIATAQPLDTEMAARIERHRLERGDSWDTFEEPHDVAGLVKRLNGRYDVMLLDCLTLWLNNIIVGRAEENDAVVTLAENLIAAIGEFGGSCIVVSNEVGLGIVPDNPLSRRFRDLAGMVNQQVAQAADEAYLLTAGIPLKIK